MLQAPDSSPRARVRKTVEIARLQMDPRARPDVPLPPPLPPSPLKPQPTPKKAGSSTLLGPRRRLINILKMNILPKNTITWVQFSKWTWMYKVNHRGDDKTEIVQNFFLGSFWFHRWKEMKNKCCMNAYNIKLHHYVAASILLCLLFCWPIITGY